MLDLKTFHKREFCNWLGSFKPFSSWRPQRTWFNTNAEPILLWQLLAKIERIWTTVPLCKIRIRIIEELHGKDWKRERKRGWEGVRQKRDGIKPAFYSINFRYQGSQLYTSQHFAHHFGRFSLVLLAFGNNSSAMADAKQPSPAAAGISQDTADAAKKKIRFVPLGELVSSIGFPDEMLTTK